MALIECRECKREVSDQAEACPHCAYPLKARTAAPAVSSNRGEMPWWIKWPLGIFGGLTLLGVLLPNPPKQYAPPKSGSSGDGAVDDSPLATCKVGKWTWDQNEFGLRVEGTIENPTGFRKISVQIEDANGNLLGTDFTYLDAVGSWRLHLSNKHSPTESIQIKYACE